MRSVTGGDGYEVRPRLDWIIYGGESGSKARPNDLSWARAVRDQCKAAGVAFFMKQAGARPRDEDGRLIVSLRDSHGADPAEWSEDLRVQQFPAWAARCDRTPR